MGLLTNARNCTRKATGFLEYFNNHFGKCGILFYVFLDCSPLFGGRAFHFKREGERRRKKERRETRDEKGERTEEERERRKEKGGTRVEKECERKGGEGGGGRGGEG